MIGMAIFLIGILAIGSLQHTAIRGNASAREATEAATLATSHLETLITMPFDNIISGGPTTQGAYTTSWAVSDNTPLPNTKTITVTVDYLDRGPKSYELTYIKTENL
jgi:Tfp pilus assembly protein PilV